MDVRLRPFEMELVCRCGPSQACTSFKFAMASVIRATPSDSRSRPAQHLRLEVASPRAEPSGRARSDDSNRCSAGNGNQAECGSSANRTLNAAGVSRRPFATSGCRAHRLSTRAVNLEHSADRIRAFLADGREECDGANMRESEVLGLCLRFVRGRFVRHAVRC